MHKISLDSSNVSNIYQNKFRDVILYNNALKYSTTKGSIISEPAILCTEVGQMEFNCLKSKGRSVILPLHLLKRSPNLENMSGIHI